MGGRPEDANLLDELVANGRFAEAEGMARRFVGNPSRHGQALTALARCAIARRDYDDALRWVDRASRVAQGDRSLSALRGVLLLASGRARDAVACLDGAWDDLPGASPGVALGQALVRVGEPARAASVVARLLRRHPVSSASGLAVVADQIVSDDRAVGWIGCDEDGMLVGALRVSALGGSLTIREGRATAPPSLVAPASEFVRRYPAPGSGNGLEKFRLAIPPREDGYELFVDVNQSPLLGAPLRLPIRARVEGVVELDGGTLRGWAWMPSEQSKSLEVTIRDGEGRTLRVLADRPLETPSPPGMGDGRHGFVLDLEGAGAAPGLFSVCAGPWEALLIGSPIRWDGGMAAPAAIPALLAWLDRADVSVGGTFDFRGAARALRRLPIPVCPMPSRKTQPLAAPTGIDVVIPVYGGHAETMACIHSVLETVQDRSVRVIVVDDASPDPGLVGDIERVAATGRIVLIRNSRNLGFPETVNIGMSMGSGRDVVLLNADTLVSGDWLARLNRAAYASHEIGTVTPMSNDAEILSYPSGASDKEKPEFLGSAAGIDRAAARANAGLIVDIPTAVGFCMYIRRNCLEEVGLFDTESFGRGYGEENDFCMRARRLGWRHVAATDVFVAHIGGRSFGSEKKLLQARNQRILERLHPGYDKLVADFISDDPLVGPRRRIDLARRAWAEASAPPADRLLVTLGLDGGVARHVDGRADAITRAGGRVLRLTPVGSKNGRQGMCRLEDSFHPDLRDTVFDVGNEFDALIRLLADARVRFVEFHHILGHDPCVLEIPLRLGVPYDVVIHDYSWICPRVALTDRNGVYCGEPDESVCELCVYENGSETGEAITVGDLRRRSSAFISGAGTVMAPTLDAATRLSRYIGAKSIKVEPWEDVSPPATPDATPMQNGRWRVCLVGAIGKHKGYQVLLDCARNAALRRLPLEFVVVGYTEDDYTLFATGRVYVTGKYRESEVIDLIRSQRAHVAFFPSLCPETWCYTLSAAWRAGLEAVAFDLGALGERIRAAKGGGLLPPLLAADGINDALLSFLTGKHT